MTHSPETRVVLRPLICFGAALALGVFGFAYAKLTDNGIWLIGFLLFYVPFAVIASILGAVFSVKAYAVLPANHWAKYVLTGVIAFVVVLLVICFLGIIELNSHSGGLLILDPVPNQAASVDAPIAFLFHIVRQWRRATEQRRWPLGLYICVTKMALLPSEISWAQSGKLRISDTH